MSEQAKFSVKGLDLYYGDFHALKDVNLDINAKEITAFIGPSGCGKSTFLKCLYRNLKPTSGVIKLDEVDLSSITVKESAKKIADLMNISDKTISKWERGLGCPDISLLPELSQILGVSIDQILSGQINLNDLVGGNMNKLKFYVCPQCGNLMTATGNATISCCGKTLEPLVAKKAED